MLYNPERPVDAEAWSKLNETEKISLVLDYHRVSNISLQNPDLHAATHVAVENQILLGDEAPVAAALDRLMSGGLSRHNAIHAIAATLTRTMQGAMNQTGVGDVKSAYYKEVSRLTTKS